ncbi:MAG: M1 family metallopeptidase [Nitrospiria bacterium]
MSKEDAGRLSPKVRPLLYRLHLTVLPAERHFWGSLSIDLTLAQAMPALRLHALDLEVDQISIGAVSCKADLDSASETITLSYPGSIPPGDATLALQFSGTLNKQMRGLYEAHADGEVYAFTQFEATDARRMFPCFDEPGMKARFRLTVTLPADLVALSNMPVTETRQNGAMKTVVFAETPPMSTYLLALAVARLEGEAIDVEGTRVAVWTLPGQLALGAFALKVVKGVLPLLNAYFDLHCPTPKLDLVSVPDFAMGAMENWGAIFFRDARLLLDEQSASTTTQRAVANVITHEIVHQWFGNLVTMAWWDDLWLNESFATWLACKIVDLWRPEWRSWQAFQEEKEIPFALDALQSTRPIRAEVRHPNQIEEMFDVLTYEKGAACLRMIEQFIGERSFRDGIRLYIKRHQYGNATAGALWEALSAVTEYPISEISQDWFNRPGFPFLYIDAGEGNFKQLHLSQGRFLARGEGSSNGGMTWSIPLSIKYKDDEGIKTYSLLLEEAQVHISLPSKGNVRFAYGNAGESGFFRSSYDALLFDALKAHAGNDLDPVEQRGCLGHLWALCQRGDLPISAYMEMIGRFKGKDTPRIVVTAICGTLEILSNHLIAPEQHKQFSDWMTNILTPLWNTVLWDPAPDEDEEIKLLRAALLWTLGAVAHHEDILAELPRRQSRYAFRPETLDPTLVTPLIRLCARSDGGSRFDQYVQKFKNSATPEERDRYLLAMADFRKPALARKLLALCLSPDVRPQDVWKPIRALLAHPPLQQETWTFIKTHWPNLREKGSSIGAKRIIQGTQNLWRPEWHEDIQDFFSRPENKVSSAEQALAQTLEFIQLGIHFKRVQSQALADWLIQNAS